VKKHPKVKDVLIGTFKTESWMEPMVTCKKTNKIYRIDSTGTVIYRENCRPAGKQKQTFTPRPTYFYKPMASGIKPNAFVRMHVPPGSDHGAKNQHRSCWVIEAYTNKQRTKLVNIYGFKP